jgi:hypothetical protein
MMQLTQIFCVECTFYPLAVVIKSSSGENLYIDESASSVDRFVSFGWFWSAPDFQLHCTHSFSKQGSYRYKKVMGVAL